MRSESVGQLRRVETASVLVPKSCLLVVVVMISWRSIGGKRSRIAQMTSLIGVEAERGRESVRGRPRPAKVVMSTLTVRSTSSGTGGMARDDIRLDDMVFAVAIFNRCSRTTYDSCNGRDVIQVAHGAANAERSPRESVKSHITMS